MTEKQGVTEELKGTGSDGRSGVNNIKASAEGIMLKNMICDCEGIRSFLHFVY